MIKFKIEKNKKGEPIFKLGIKAVDIEKNILLKRAILESEKIKGNYNYKIPLRFFVPIFNNIDKSKIKLDIRSQLQFLEFWDDFDEKYYSTIVATPKFMKIWREENCPNIFKIKINPETLELSKEIAFKRLDISVGSL